MRLISVGLVVSLAIAVPATAQDSAPRTTEAPQVKPEKAKRICRSIPVTGQRIPRRECKSEAEWASIDGLRDSNEAMRIRSTPNGSN